MTASREKERVQSDLYVLFRALDSRIRGLIMTGDSAAESLFFCEIHMWRTVSTPIAPIKVTLSRPTESSGNGIYVNDPLV